jgi:hypothetical protein
MTYVLSICIATILVLMLTLIFYLAHELDKERDRVRELMNLVSKSKKLSNEMLEL